MARALALGRLLRLSLAPSAPADVAAGFVLAAGAFSGRAPWIAMLASACVYHGGLALNDWADRHEDARTRPGRPIPSGAIPARAALVLALLLLAGGPLLALAGARAAAGPLALVSALALSYDLAGRGPWRGPLLLGLCRAGNLGAGLALGAGGMPPRSFLLLVPLLYGLFVFAVSRLARLEDAADAELARARPARWLATAALLLLCLAAAAAVCARATSSGSALVLAPLLVGAGGAYGLARTAAERRGRAWSHAELEQGAGLGLRRLLVASAATALGAGAAGLAVALVILAGYPLAFALRRVFPPS